VRASVVGWTLKLLDGARLGPSFCTTSDAHVMGTARLAFSGAEYIPGFCSPFPYKPQKLIGTANFSDPLQCYHIVVALRNPNLPVNEQEYHLTKHKQYKMWGPSRTPPEA
jgi:hypothetical protein